MSKRAEEAALKVFPVLFSERNGLDYTFQDRRNAFEKGYEQAEKDYIELAELWVGSGDANIMSFKQFLKCHETQSNK